MSQEPADATPSVPIQASPRSPRGSRTICLPLDEQDYVQILSESTAFRAWLDRHYQQTPELFPPPLRKGITSRTAERRASSACNSVESPCSMGTATPFAPPS